MEWKKTPWIWKLLLILILAGQMFALAQMRRAYTAKQDEAATLAQAVTGAKQEQQRLLEATETMDTAEGIEEIARTKLGLAFPGEITFHDAGS